MSRSSDGCPSARATAAGSFGGGVASANGGPSVLRYGASTAVPGTGRPSVSHTNGQNHAIFGGTAAPNQRRRPPLGTFLRVGSLTDSGVSASTISGVENMGRFLCVGVLAAVVGSPLEAVQPAKDSPAAAYTRTKLLK